MWKWTETGPQPATGPLSGPTAGGLDDGGDGDADIVGGLKYGRPHPHGGRQPAVVRRGRGKPRHLHTAGLLTSLNRALILRGTTQ